MLKFSRRKTQKENNNVWAHHCMGQTLQFLLNPDIVFISSSVSSKSNTCKDINSGLHPRAKSKWSRLRRLILENIWAISQLITWKFSWMRWGVIDFGITITFLWMLKRIRTWQPRTKGINMGTWSEVMVNKKSLCPLSCVCAPLYRIITDYTFGSSLEDEGQQMFFVFVHNNSL